MHYLPLETKALLLPLAVLALTVAGGYAFMRVFFARLARWSKKTSNEIDDVIIAALKRPLMFFFVLLGAYLAVSSSGFSGQVVHFSGKFLFVAVILLTTVILADIAGNLIRLYSTKLHTSLPATSLTSNIVRLIVIVIGVLVILNSLGVSIAPILATLGVGGLAVALALQDTLSNLFSGFYIIASRQIRVGDYVKLDSGEEGYVMDINWRSTKIRMLANNTILVPNEKLTKATITNYYLPDTEMAVLVNLGVHYKSDLKKVERVTCEVAKQVLSEVAGGVAGFEPFIRYSSFGDSSVNFTVILRAKEFVDQYLIKHEFIKKLHERYQQEGIVIPYPIRAINYDQEK